MREPARLLVLGIRRLSACILDYFIFYVLAVTCATLFPVEGTDVWFQVFCLILVWVLCFPASEAWRGYTFGKGLFRLRVVRDDGGKATSRQTIARHLLDPIDVFVFGFVAVLTVRRAPDSKRLGDLMAHTIIVGKKETFGQPSKTAMTKPVKL